jgi:hypothetical protein
MTEGGEHLILIHATQKVQVVKVGWRVVTLQIGDERVALRKGGEVGVSWRFEDGHVTSRAVVNTFVDALHKRALDLLKRQAVADRTGQQL